MSISLPPRRPRTPTQIIAIGDGELVVKCNDGTIWVIRDDYTEWVRLPDAPQ